MDDIAEAVGIARPNLYRDFLSKGSLVKRVTIEEARRINAARRANIVIRGPVAPIISRSIIDGIAMARADDYLTELMTHENAAMAARAIADHGPDDVRMEYWRPILAHGRARRELRTGLTDEQIVHWLGVVQMLFLENQELSSGSRSRCRARRRLRGALAAVPARAGQQRPRRTTSAAGREGTEQRLTRSGAGDMLPTKDRDCSRGCSRSGRCRTGCWYVFNALWP